VSTHRVLLARLNLSNTAQNKHPSHCTPPYTLKYIQAILLKNRQFDVKLLDAMPGRLTNLNILEQTYEWKPKILVLLVNVVTLKESRRLISQIRKKQKVFTVAVGSIVPELTSEELDVYLPGEGEQEACHLIKRLLTGMSSEQDEIDRYRLTKRDSSTRFLVEDPDNLPFPEYSQSDMKDYHFIYPIRTFQKLVWGHILSSRGCPYPCSFCSPVTRESYGVKVRLRSAVNIVDEMANLKERGVNIISFDDDLFTLSRDHVKSVCREICNRKLDLKWIAHSRIDNVDYDLLKDMRNAGCELIRFGVESGSKKILKLIQKAQPRTDWRKKTKEIFDYARDLNIATHALLIIGNPTETEDEIEETFTLTRELMPDGMQIHFFNPYPGSTSYEKYKDQFNADDVLDMHHYADPKVNISAIDTIKLTKLRSRFYQRIWFNPKYLFRHIYNYALFYWNNKDVFFRLSRAVISLDRS